MEELFGVVAGVVGVCAILASVLLVWKTRGLRRRLFLTLLAVALLPAATVGLVTWQETSALGRLTDAPGLVESTDAGVQLARRALADLEARLDERVAGWSGPADDALLAGEGVLRVDCSSAADGPGVAGLTRDEICGLDGTGRRRGEHGMILYCTIETTGRSVPGTDSHSVFLQPLDAALSGQLEAAGAGAAGVRQLGLYYEEILRGRVLVVAASVLLGSVLLALLVSAGLTNRLVAPLVQLADAARRVSAGERSVELPGQGVDEVGDLLEDFGEMTRQLARGESRLRQSERLAAWQGIARRLAHEIKNPLTPIHLAVHRARTRSGDPVVVDSLRAIEEETRNLQRLAEEFSALGRLPAPVRRPVEFNVLAREVASLYLPSDVELRLGTEGVVLDADEGQLRQVVSNLFKNAVEAMDAPGQVSVCAETRGALAVISVADTGCGLPEPSEQVFEPEFTTRSSGTGLGLAIARRIVEDHGGSIEARSAESGGAEFRIHWPLASVEDTDAA